MKEKEGIDTEKNLSPKLARKPPRTCSCILALETVN